MLIVITILLFLLLPFVCWWVLFEKAGKPGWAAIIPIYNLIVILEIVRKPIWWILMFIIPVVNLVFFIMMYIEFAKAYGKDTGYAIGLVFLPFIFLPVMAFSADIKYVGVPEQQA